MKKNIVIIGPDKEMKGGISTVIKGYFSSEIGIKYNLISISSYGDFWIMSFVKGILKYISLILQNKIHIVHLNVASKGSFMRKYLFYILTPRSKKIIMHIHGGGFINFYSNSNRLIKAMIKNFIRGSHRVVVVSEYFRKAIIDNFSVEEDKVITIYNGIALEDKNIDFTQKKKQMLYLGKLNEAKGVYDLIKALTSIKDQVKDFNFVIAGNGEVEKVKKLVAHNELQNFVQVAGWVQGEEKEKYLRESSVLIMPSHFEAFGISIVEGMQYGLAVIATRVGGIPEIVSGDINGIIVEPGDVTSLSQAIKTYINQEEALAAIGKINVNHCKKFNINSSIRKIDEVYQSL